MAGKAVGCLSHHLRSCSSSVVAFSCQPANNGRLSGPAGKTGRPAAAKLSAAVKFGWSFKLFVFGEVSEAALIRRGLDLTMGSHRSFHRQALSAVAVVPLPPSGVRKDDGCECSPLVFLP